MEERRKSYKCPTKDCKGFIYYDGNLKIHCTNCKYEKPQERKEHNTPLLKEYIDEWR